MHHNACRGLTMGREVLVIEDNPEIAHLLQINLSDIDCQVELASNGSDGLDAALGRSFDLIILDLMLPELDGVEVCRCVRQRDAYTPILMLTARTSEIDRVLGLELGADDYMTKPFSIRELLARVKALFRRSNLTMQSNDNDEESACISSGNMNIDIVRRNVSIGGEEVELTAREFDLLVHFASHPGRVYSRSQLLDQVWGYGHDGYEHTVNSHINRLRSKIEFNPAHPEYVLTVWGVGYKFYEHAP